MEDNKTVSEGLEAEKQGTLEQENETPPRKRPNLILLIGVAVVWLALLAGAAFVGGRLLMSRVKGGNPLLSGPFSLLGFGGKEVRGTLKLDVEPAKELPATPPEATGIFLRREERSVFIGTGKVTGVAISKEGKVSMDKMSHDGPVIEVVTTQDTLIYRNATPFPDSPSSTEKIQQVVEPGSLDDLDENTSLTVWGERRGDRIVAQVLLYTQPRFIMIK